MRNCLRAALVWGIAPGLAGAGNVGCAGCAASRASARAGESCRTAARMFAWTAESGIRLGRGAVHGALMESERAEAVAVMARDRERTASRPAFGEFLRVSAPAIASSCPERPRMVGESRSPISFCVAAGVMGGTALRRSATVIAATLTWSAAAAPACSSARRARTASADGGGSAEASSRRSAARAVAWLWMALTSATELMAVVEQIQSATAFFCPSVSNGSCSRVRRKEMFLRIGLTMQSRRA